MQQLDERVRRHFERIAPAMVGPTPDLATIAEAMVDLARDHDYLMPRIRSMGRTSGAVDLHCPERGPRLLLVHRETGEMGATHDHRCWVVLAPVTGVETHRHFRRSLDRAGVERLELATEQALRAGQAATMLQPDDIHSHGHVAGVGEPAYLLIMTGDNQRAFRRTEWDTRTGRARTLEIGDIGRWTDTEPFPAT